MNKMTLMHDLTCDGVRLGHQAGQTSADGVALGVGGAGGAGAAGAGAAGVRPLHTSLASTHEAILAVRVNDALWATPWSMSTS